MCFSVQSTTRSGVVVVGSTHAGGGDEGIHSSQSYIITVGGYSREAKREDIRVSTLYHRKRTWSCYIYNYCSKIMRWMDGRSIVAYSKKQLIINNNESMSTNKSKGEGEKRQTILLLWQKY